MPNFDSTTMIIFSIIFSLIIGLAYGFNKVSKKLVKSNNVEDDGLQFKNMSSRAIIQVNKVPGPVKKVGPLELTPEQIDSVIKNRGL
ncbi:MAG: hypothetical protein MJ108_08800 [Saccharofermentans sp.]|nr:hypothetical protein [Saccharofermentans sp.]